MNNATWQRLFGFRHAFDDPVTVVLTLAAAALLLLAPLLIFITTRAAKSTADKRKELWDRYRSWIWLVLVILIPILAGAFWTIVAVATLSFLCYREYARITGLFLENEPSVSSSLSVFSLPYFCRTGQFVSTLCRVMPVYSRIDRYRRVDR
jgi:phosphatidate cytidylyltransferase